MQCTVCGNDNPPEARFCGYCGSAFSTQATPTPPPQVEEAIPAAGAPSAAAIPAEAPLRISIFSAAVGLFILGLIVGELLFWRPYEWYYFVYDPLSAVSPWVGIGLGVAAALWLSLRFLRTGRLPSAAGMVLIVVGLVIGRGYFNTVTTMIGFGIVGLGLGLLFPVTFWRNIAQVSTRGKVALETTVVAGLVAGWLGWEFLLHNVTILTALVALFIGLPSVLISPVVRTAR